MSEEDLVKLTAYWGNGDAGSTIQITPQQWNVIKSRGGFQKSASSFYEREIDEVTWLFSNSRVSIDGNDGMQCIVDLPVDELIRNGPNSEQSI